MTAASRSDARKRNASPVDPVEVVRSAIHEVPGIECDHIEGGTSVCQRDAHYVVLALRAEGLLA